jgi:glycosyltransferase involved in cell wall biosynthesis
MGGLPIQLFMKIVFLAYNYLPEFDSPEAWIERISPFVGVMEALAKKAAVSYAGRISYEGEFVQNDVAYRFLKDPSHFSRRLHKLVKSMDPDIVVVPGFHFPLQVTRLKGLLGNKAKIVAEHHADKPGRGIRKFLQKRADKFIGAYHFTSMGNAKPWRDAGIIRDPSKCREIPSGSAGFQPQKKDRSREKLKMGEGPNFIWIGRLNANKDPLTLLSAFGKYLTDHPSAKLYMIYQEDDLLEEIKNILEQNAGLKKAVNLQGYVPHEELETWLSAADFYISASRTEGGSIALLEAMACGCIPIVTNIPASTQVIGSGKFGLLFQPGDAEDLYWQLLESRKIDQNSYSARLIAHFEKEYSFAAIAEKFLNSCRQLMSE